MKKLRIIVGNVVQVAEYQASSRPGVSDICLLPKLSMFNLLQNNDIHHSYRHNTTGCSWIVWNIFVFEYDLNGVFEKIVASVVCAAWIAMIPQHAVLALNRWIVIRRVVYSAQSSKSETLLFNFLLLLCYLLGFVFFVLFMGNADTPMMISLHGDDDAPTFSFIPLGSKLAIIDVVCTAPFPIICMLIYTALTLHISKTVCIYD
uniref:Uncharacterized protein n=1 Tax=Ditylenchus dipsaci TaxID=166011 RepID=A0A915ETF7_9BILA